MLIPKKCRLCRAPFKTSFPEEVLCKKCRKSLPLCGSCHNAMGRDYGYLEDFARQVGKYKLCGGCNYELTKKHFLTISNSQILLPDGRVKTKKVPAADKGCID